MKKSIKVIGIIFMFNFAACSEFSSPEVNQANDTIPTRDSIADTTGAIKGNVTILKLDSSLIKADTVKVK